MYAIRLTCRFTRAGKKIRNGDHDHAAFRKERGSFPLDCHIIMVAFQEVVGWNVIQALLHSISPVGFEFHAEKH